jgi:hypothetical protein
MIVRKAALFLLFGQQGIVGGGSKCWCARLLVSWGALARMGSVALGDPVKVVIAHVDLCVQVARLQA